MKGGFITLQTLTFTAVIQIPETHVLLTKIEFDQLQQQILLGKYWSMKDLENHINKKQEWIKERILYPTAFRKILDCENGGFVYYPGRKGEHWSFQALKMAEFLEVHFNQIFSN